MTIWTRRALTVLAALATAARAQVAIDETAERLVLHSHRTTVALGKAQMGAVVSLVDNASGREFAAPQAEPTLFRLTFTKAGDTSGATESFPSRTASEVYYHVEGNAATIRYRGIGGRGIEATCTASVSADDPLVRWRIAVTGPEALVLEEIQFPILVLADTLGEARADDVALVGATEHGQLLAPGDWRVGRQWTYTQPGSLAAQFACYYDPACGFFAGTQDGKGYPKKLVVARTDEGLSFVWSHLEHHALDKPFTLDYDMVCTTFRGQGGEGTDWRDAADIHKAWAVRQPWCARTVSQRADIPDWVRRGTVRIQWDLRGDGTPEAVIDWLDRHWAEHFAPLPPFVTFFGFEHAGSWVAPKYTPFYPSDEAFRKATKRIRELGGHTFLFPSGYHWTLTYDKRPDGSFAWDDRADFTKRGAPHAMRERDGSLVMKSQSWLRGGQNAALCRGDAWSRQFICDSMAQLLERGVDVLQMDQVVGGRWPADGRTVCFSSDHGHAPGHGLWDVTAYHAQMKALRNLANASGHAVLFSQESPQELVVQDFQLFDYRHDRAVFNVKIWDLEPKKHAPVFPYLYHEFVPVFHIPSHSEPYPVILAHAIASGEIPSCKPSQIDFPGAPIVANAGFAKWSDGPADWRVWRSHGENKVKVSREDGALRLDSTEEDDTVHVYQYLPLDGEVLRVGGTYRLRLRMKAEGAEQTGGMDLVALDSPDWRVWKTLASAKADAPADSEWHEHALTLTVPPRTQILRAILRIGGKGTIRFGDLAVEEILPDGTARKLVRPGNAVFRLLRQWAQLAAKGSGKYLMQGTMLHPPPLDCQSTRVTVLGSKPTNLDLRIYALQADHRTSVAYASCPIAIPGGEGDWEQKSLEITLKPGAAELHIPLSLRHKGELLLDDFALTEVGGTKNLLANGDFEDWPDPATVPPGWTHIAEYQGRTFGGTFHREGQDTHPGSHAIRLVNPTDDDAVHVKQILPVDGTKLVLGKTYRLSFWAKVRHMARAKPIQVEHQLPAILHNAFRAPDGTTATLLVNITGQPQSGALTWNGTKTALTLDPWQLRLVTDTK